MSYEVALLSFGVILLLLGLIGRVKAKEIDVGTSSAVARVIVAVIGLALIVVSFDPGGAVSKIASQLGKGEEGVEKPAGEAAVGPTPMSAPTPAAAPAPTPVQADREPFVGSLAGEYRIQVEATKLYLHEDGHGDRLLSTRHQPNDDFTRFILEKQADGSYRIRVKANNRYLHVDEGSDKLVSTRYQPDDDFTRFAFERDAAGAYRIRVKADGTYLHVNGWGDKLLSTRYQPNDDFTRFRLRRTGG